MARPKTGRTVVAKNLTLRPADWATIDAHAKAAGLLSRSAGLRSILVEWKQLLAAEKERIRRRRPLPR